MNKKVFYTYNPATDDFERYYPSMRSRMTGAGKLMLASALLAAAICLVIFYVFPSPTLENLREENTRLKEHYAVLDRRLENSLKIMEDIRNRDDNFYRVMMQMDPQGDASRYAGLDNEQRYVALRRLSDASIVEEVTRNMDLLERELYAQSVSFDRLRQAAISQQDRMAHIPQVIPIDIKDYTIASGYGYRIDPIYGTSKFHEGLDFAAPAGTPVYASANGKVVLARREDNYGNSVVVEHGYDYRTRYAHLSQILVKEGESVTRGKIIGRVGSTGKSTGPHLHYEVLFKGEPQNPVNYYFMDIGPAEYEEMMRKADNAGHVMD